MINKKQLAIFIIALIVVSGLVVVGFRRSNTTSDGQNISSDITPQTTEDVWPSREVEKIDASQKAAYAVITASYPKAESEAVTMYFKNFVEDQIMHFLEDTAWAAESTSAESEHLMLDITYASTQASTVETYVFSVNSYTGGAHGMQVRTTFSFNKDGQLLSLANLFKNGLTDLPKFASLVQKELLKREGAQAEWIKDGASAKEDNYRSFIVTDTGITVLMDPYQVGPYSDGAISVSISKESFAAFANPVLFWVTTR